MQPPAPLIVSQHEAGCYSSIGEALRQASPGARILVRPGTYDEQLLIEQPIQIIGDGPRKEIVITVSGASRLVISAERALVRGLTIRGMASPEGPAFHAVDLPAGAPVIEDCEITCGSLACVAIHGPDANPTIRRCLVHDGQGGGIVVFDQGRGLVEECKTFGNTHAGIAITPGCKPIIRRCQIYDELSNEGQGRIEDCEIYSDPPVTTGEQRDWLPFGRGFEVKLGAALLGPLGGALAAGLWFLLRELLGWHGGLLLGLAVPAIAGALLTAMLLWYEVPALGVEKRLFGGALLGGVIGSFVGPAGLLIGIGAGLLISALLLGWELLASPGGLVGTVGAAIGAGLGLLVGLAVWLVLWITPEIVRVIASGAVVGAIIGGVGAFLNWEDYNSVRRPKA